MELFKPKEKKWDKENTSTQKNEQRKTQTHKTQTFYNKKTTFKSKQRPDLIVIVIRIRIRIDKVSLYWGWESVFLFFNLKVWL